MPTNIEIKARVKDPQRLRMLAEHLSDVPPETIEQHDTFFPCDRGRLKLRRFSPESGELIVYSRADGADAKQSDYAIARISNPGELLAVLSAAYGVERTVTKTRVLLRAGQTRIHLDTVKELGSFVELEVALHSSQPPEDGHRIVQELMNALEISHEDLVEGAYADLLPE